MFHQLLPEPAMTNIFEQSRESVGDQGSQFGCQTLEHEEKKI